MMLNLFKCYLASVCPLIEDLCSFLLRIFQQECFLPLFLCFLFCFANDTWEFTTFSRYKAFVGYGFCKHILLICSESFFFFPSLGLLMEKNLILKSNLWRFLSVDCALGINSKNYLALIPEYILFFKKFRFLSFCQKFSKSNLFYFM